MTSGIFSSEASAHLQLGADGGAAVMAEIQHGIHADAETQQHAQVIHQQRGGPAPTVLCAPGMIDTGGNKLEETLQACLGIPEQNERSNKRHFSQVKHVLHNNVN